MKIIGITGGVGAGKSEILSFIRQNYACEIYLADEVAHKIKEKGEPCYDRLVNLLGEEVLDDDGQINKGRMAAIIFADEAILQKVNEIIHPGVKEYIMNRMNEAAAKPEVQYFFIEAALLIEAGYREVVDELWYIYADKEVRMKRLQENRGYSIEKIEQIMNSQLSEEVFLQYCDFVIDNSGKIEDSYSQIRKRLENEVTVNETV
jgi:dephospho-CoA kinase